MRKGWFLVLLAFLTITACGPRETVKKPEVFLTEEQMVDVLSDSYLVEAMLNRRRGAGENITGLQRAYYAKIFEHYGITDSIFEQNITYYSYHLETLERIMDSVNQRFEKEKK